MSATELLCRMMGVDTNKLSREENFILEIEIFIHVCKEIEKIIKSQYKDYYRLMRFNTATENTMFEENLIRHVINDILLTEEYSLEGIAYYTQTPEEVICDVLAGTNPAPSLPLFRKIIELHRFVKPNFYREIMKKITSEYLTPP